MSENINNKVEKKEKKKINFKKIFLWTLLITISIPVSEYVYRMHFNYNFQTITEGKVYKSGVIEPDKIKDYVKKYKIKTIVDLRNGSINTKLNPASFSDITKEKIATSKIERLNYFHVPSHQVPGKVQLTKFFEIMDNDDNYPVLIHCHHGTGRAMMYSALYRIEYEDFSKEEARDKTRKVLKFLGYKSSFSEGKEKGDFLISYKNRNEENSTISNLK